MANDPLLMVPVRFSCLISVNSLSLFVQATKDLENYDAERHEEFKRYEMLKEHERREYLKGLDQEKREREERRMQELKEKHRQHPKVNAPVRTCVGFHWKRAEAKQALLHVFPLPFCLQGSVAQLREVWEETDGLDPQEFNPKTFFKLHGEGLRSSADIPQQFSVNKVLASSLCRLDTNEDDVLDEQELEALFTKEVRSPRGTLCSKLFN